MQITVIGAGIQARAICHALLAQADVETVVLADVSEQSVAALASVLNDPRVVGRVCDASDYKDVKALLEGSCAAISAAPYHLNEKIARAAIAAVCSFCDLGGNNDVVAQELAMDKDAKLSGIAIVPDCGLAPGLGSILTAHAVKHMKSVDSVSIRCGGIPQKKDGFLNYALFFSEQGVVNEYVEDAMILVDGKIWQVPSLEAFEEVEFHPPWVGLEAFTTSGGASTLPITYEGKIRSLDYKTIRWTGHGQIFRGMKRLGLLSGDPIKLRGGDVIPREVVESRMAATLDRNTPDVILLRVTARGGNQTRTYEAVEFPADGMSAMARMTGFPAALVLLMLARGQIDPGARPQELCVDPDVFLDGLDKLGIDIEREAR